MHNVHRLFGKYGQVTSLEALPLTAINTLHPDPSGRYTERNLPDVNPPTGTRKHASKRSVACMGKKE
jgi:hypothetical protein